MFIVLSKCLIICCWLLEFKIWKFLGKFVLWWWVCKMWWDKLWKVLIYILLIGVFKVFFIWVCIFFVVLLVKVIVKMLYVEVCLICMSYVMWWISIWVLLEFVFVSISMFCNGVVIVFCCLLFKLLSNLEMFIVMFF